MPWVVVLNPGALTLTLKKKKTLALTLKKNLWTFFLTVVQGGCATLKNFLYNLFISFPPFWVTLHPQQRYICDTSEVCSLGSMTSLHWRPPLEAAVNVMQHGIRRLGGAMVGHNNMTSDKDNHTYFCELCSRVCQLSAQSVHVDRRPQVCARLGEEWHERLIGVRRQTEKLDPELVVHVIVAVEDLDAHTCSSGRV